MRIKLIRKESHTRLSFTYLTESVPFFEDRVSYDSSRHNYDITSYLVAIYKREKDKRKIYACIFLFRFSLSAFCPHTVVWILGA